MCFLFGKRNLQDEYLPNIGCLQCHNIGYPILGQKVSCNDLGTYIITALRNTMSLANRKQQRKKWNAEAMLAAISAVKNNEMGYLLASKTFNVPKSTLEDYVKNKSRKSPEEMIRTNLGRPPVLPKDIEVDLVDYCVEMDKRFYGLRASDIRRLAFQLAIRNNLKHNFSQKEKTADETGITTVQSKHTRIITLKGKKQVGAVTSAERGALVTVVTCMNAAGGYVPPMIIFPRKNMKLELLNGTPPGTVAACHVSGWIQSHIFTKWLQHFITHVKPSEADPTVLVLDGHYSHTRNIDTINLARQNHVIIICLPPHSTHRMQPLDLAFMGPLKTYYSQEIENWLRHNPGRVVTSYQICELLGKAYVRCATAEIAINGFRKSGILPFNRHIFRDHDFAIHHQVEAPATSAEELRHVTPPRDITTTKCVEQSYVKRMSHSPDPKVRAHEISPIPSTSFYKSSAKERKSRKGSAALITGTPYKDALEASLSEQNRKKSVSQGIPKLKMVNKSVSSKVTNKKKGKSIAKKNVTPKVSKKNVKKQESSDSSEEDEDLVLDDDSDLDCDIGEEEADCMFCSGVFSDDHAGEQWIQCSKCFKWAHCDCANIGRKDTYICDFCLDG
ncbi:hypothetical protein MML48_9g00014898 [Holotrichia oblita]|uniref:Uncharacterized protein n=1 Tax=Holotrichia oblita TaxID=644536 RepID=A0ACB9SKG4_HOLOL|nr:hypothetical protein MML48_9g00014898 [Holotrichia oblita]